MTIPSDHLRACNEHGVVGGGAGGAGECPCCAVESVVARPNQFSGSIKPLDIQWHMGDGMMIHLLNRLVPDVEQHGDDVGPVYVAVGALPERELPTGYTPQERYVNAVFVEIAGNPKHRLIREKDHSRVIEAIEQDGGFAKPPEYDYDRLEPENWQGVADYYCRDVEYDRVAEDTLRIEMSGFRSDNRYRQARKELGDIAQSNDLSIRTVEAGGAWKDAIIEVSIP